LTQSLSHIAIGANSFAFDICKYINY